MKFAPTVLRQLVMHGHVKVSGQRCNIPSRMITIGDTIELKEKSRGIPAVMEGMAFLPSVTFPNTSPLTKAPSRAASIAFRRLADVPYPVQMEPNLVIEFYSR